MQDCQMLEFTFFFHLTSVFQSEVESIYFNHRLLIFCFSFTFFKHLKSFNVSTKAYTNAVNLYCIFGSSAWEKLLVFSLLINSIFMLKTVAVNFPKITLNKESDILQSSSQNRSQNYGNNHILTEVKNNLMKLFLLITAYVGKLLRSWKAF